VQVHSIDLGSSSLCAREHQRATVGKPANQGDGLIVRRGGKFRDDSRLRTIEQVSRPIHQQLGVVGTSLRITAPQDDSDMFPIRGHCTGLSCNVVPGHRHGIADHRLPDDIRD
jgi:hypothetical protein